MCVWLSSEICFYKVVHFSCICISFYALLLLTPAAFYSWQGSTSSPEILPPSDLPSHVNGILWELSELITQEHIAVGSSNLVEGLTT